MPDNKLVIRRLPPTLSEDDFLKQISPLPDYDYFCYFGPNSGVGQHCFCRAYINFLNTDEMNVFRERFDNYVFLDKDGHEYPAVVEQPLWPKSCKNGPFYISKQQCINKESTNNETDWTNNQGIKMKTKESDKLISLEEDPEFLEFVAKINSQRKR